MKQKFRMFSFVKVGDNLGRSMKLYPRDFHAIVAGTCSQLHGGADTDSYSLYRLDKQGKIVDSIAWYPEHALTLLGTQNRDRAEEMVEDWNRLGCDE